MGSKQSALKKEINHLRHEARTNAAKYQEELGMATQEKRQLQLKIDELQEIATKAQLEVDKARNEAQQQEERMKALKWELVRQMKLSGSPVAGSSRSLTASSPEQIPLNWRLNDDVALRQSAASPKKSLVAASTSNNNDSNQTPKQEQVLTKPAEPGNHNQLVADAEGKEAKVPTGSELKATASVESLSDNDNSTFESSTAKDGDEPIRKIADRIKHAESKGSDDPETNNTLSFSDSDESST